jgi:hypothetical protein
MFSRGHDGLVGVGPGGEWDEIDVGDFVDGSAAYLGDLLAGTYRYEEE